ncbi:MAG TPA: hypothetical protein VFI11_13110 [Anaerolineales bacterium]|nr:hypothetical protein [Anaerolineales bacterium]
MVEHDHSSGPSMFAMAIVAIIAIAVVAFVAINVFNLTGDNDGGGGNPLPTIIPSLVPGDATQPSGYSIPEWSLAVQAAPTAL